MSVLIKGMDMPLDCSNCDFCRIVDGHYYCNRTKHKISVYYGFRQGDCPIINILAPHGRLIDADALMECRLEPNHYEELKDGYIPDYDLDSAPTIIEAEVSDNA